jgi:hypothetical protein
MFSVHMYPGVKGCLSPAAPVVVAPDLAITGV